jgi:hypothetical protein
MWRNQVLLQPNQAVTGWKTVLLLPAGILGANYLRQAQHTTNPRSHAASYSGSKLLLAAEQQGSTWQKDVFVQLVNNIQLMGEGYSVDESPHRLLRPQHHNNTGGSVHEDRGMIVTHQNPLDIGT